MNKFFLIYNLHEYIEIDFPSPFEEAFYMDIVSQKFHTKDGSYIIEHTDILTILRDDWIIGLKETLNNQRSLKFGIQGLGYEWNQVCMDEISYDDWWGINYLIAEGGDEECDTATWLYNNNKGEIIFEITEKYFWRADDQPSEDQDYITYQEFMKNYKPLVTRVIPHEIARRWLVQCEHLFEQICENERIQKEHRKGKEQIHKEGKCEECNAKGITYE